MWVKLKCNLLCELDQFRIQIDTSGSNIYLLTGGVLRFRIWASWFKVRLTLTKKEVGNSMADNVQPASTCASLIEEMRSLQLSTIGEDDIPHCGYTPYLHRAPNSFYIFVSQLAAHTRNLLIHTSVATMIIADEQSTSQIFARTRVNYLCEAKRIARDSSDYEPALDAYVQRHGKAAGLLRQLPDFILFQLQPQSGQFVMGFGQAYTLTGDDLSVFEHARTG